MKNFIKWVLTVSIVISILIFGYTSSKGQTVKKEKEKKITLFYTLKKKSGKKVKKITQLHNVNNGNIYETGSVKIILRPGEKKEYNVGVSESDKGVTINFIEEK